jgi:hypothetical protein
MAIVSALGAGGGSATCAWISFGSSIALMSRLAGSAATAFLVDQSISIALWIIESSSPTAVFGSSETADGEASMLFAPSDLVT